ncbi:hypothetical protein IP91_03942 [Pseudoduganella lurida]|uniref:DUF2986 domain-containing protein n=1 Tax=Pseudoduganella lurida TaxID=1036180 RepID=A0A562R227_9BURK|nr:hypothetical protein [Pseudoduganella lurida]TWI63101.1 hypothetical protein IP91_03942 [Pseudoduganella lurida]
MANKALATRQKMRLLAQPVKPRNPFAALAKSRAAGPHERSKSAERQAAKVAIAKAKLKADPED